MPSPLQNKKNCGFNERTPCNHEVVEYALRMQIKKMDDCQFELVFDMFDVVVIGKKTDGRFSGKKGRFGIFME